MDRTETTAPETRPPVNRVVAALLADAAEAYERHHSPESQALAAGGLDRVRAAAAESISFRRTGRRATGT